jgi:hypothetical protein
MELCTVRAETDCGGTFQAELTSESPYVGEPHI